MSDRRKDIEVYVRSLLQEAGIATSGDVWNTSLEDLGVDSLAFIIILSALEKRFSFVPGSLGKVKPPYTLGKLLFDGRDGP